MKLYRLKSSGDGIKFSQYYNNKIWSDENLINLECLKVNLFYKEKLGIKRCEVEEFESED